MSLLPSWIQRGQWLYCKPRDLYAVVEGVGWRRVGYLVVKARRWPDLGIEVIHERLLGRDWVPCCPSPEPLVFWVRLLGEDLF